jgi:hypothetical protein
LEMLLEAKKARSTICLGRNGLFLWRTAMASR